MALAAVARTSGSGSTSADCDAGQGAHRCAGCTIMGLAHPTVRMWAAKHRRGQAVRLPAQHPGGGPARRATRRVPTSPSMPIGPRNRLAIILQLIIKLMSAFEIPPTHLDLRQQQRHVGRHVAGVVHQGAQVAHNAAGSLLEVACGGPHGSAVGAADQRKEQAGADQASARGTILWLPQGHRACGISTAWHLLHDAGFPLSTTRLVLALPAACGTQPLSSYAPSRRCHHVRRAPPALLCPPERSRRPRCTTGMMRAREGASTAGV